MIPINIEKLNGYKKIAWSEDYFFETIDKKSGMWFYNVNETSMNSYYGHLSIFEKNRNDIPILSSGKVWVHYSKNNTFIYARKSDCLIFRMPVYQQKTNISDYPYLLIKPSHYCPLKTS